MTARARCLRLSAAAFVALAASCAEPAGGPPAGSSSAHAQARDDEPAPDQRAAVSTPADEDGITAAPPITPLVIPPVTPLDPSLATPPRPGPPSIVVDVAAQELILLAGDAPIRTYPVSTSKVGTGSRSGSLRTPLGLHRVAQKFGDGAAPGTVFRSRASTGRVAEILTDRTDVEEDLVLTRILWLEGLEDGRNRGAGIDTKARYIYIHGTNEEGLIGTPVSHGCVRMRNADVIELFERVPVGAEVTIVESRH